MAPERAERSGPGTRRRLRPGPAPARPLGGSAPGGAFPGSWSAPSRARGFPGGKRPPRQVRLRHRLGWSPRAVPRRRPCRPGSRGGPGPRAWPPGGWTGGAPWPSGTRQRRMCDSGLAFFPGAERIFRNCGKECFLPGAGPACAGRPGALLPALGPRPRGWHAWQPAPASADSTGAAGPGSPERSWGLCPCPPAAREPLLPVPPCPPLSLRPVPGCRPLKPRACLSALGGSVHICSATRRGRPGTAKPPVRLALCLPSPRRPIPGAGGWGAVARGAGAGAPGTGDLAPPSVSPGVQGARRGPGQRAGGACAAGRAEVGPPAVLLTQQPQEGSRRFLHSSPASACRGPDFSREGGGSEALGSRPGVPGHLPPLPGPAVGLPSPVPRPLTVSRLSDPQPVPGPVWRRLTSQEFGILGSESRSPAPGP